MSGSDHAQRIVASALESRVLAGPHALYVYVPAGYSRNTVRRYPVVYLLHGAPGAAADWLAQTDVQATADRLTPRGCSRR